MMQEKLSQDLKLLEKQIYWLSLSFNECEIIGIKPNYTDEEFGKFETLCSRYSRSIDFLIRKIFRSIDEYEFENQGTLIDVVNNAHKRGLVQDIELLRTMKDVRNTIVHEYIEEELLPVFEEVMDYTYKLIDMMSATADYIKRLVE